MLKITKVKRNSIAKELGLEVGDEIVAFDNHACEDELDYLYYCEADFFTMTVRDKRSGGETVVEIEKDEGEDLGLEFEKKHLSSYLSQPLLVLFCRSNAQGYERKPVYQRRRLLHELFLR